MRKSILRFIIFIIIFFQIGCQTESLQSTPQMPTISNPYVTPTHIISDPVHTNTAHPITPTVEGMNQDSAVLRISPIASPTPTEVTFTMCSPLAYETIPALWDILSGTFDEAAVSRENLHAGVDFFYSRLGNRSSIEGESIQAILPGTVSASIEDRLPYGNMVIIETNRDNLPIELVSKFDLQIGESLYSLFAHMQKPLALDVGDHIACGQVLGTVGKTGKDIAYAHLHLETRIGPAGTEFSGMAFYDTGATPTEMDNYVLWRTSGTFRPVDPMLIFSEYLVEITQDNDTPIP